MTAGTALDSTDPVLPRTGGVRPWLLIVAALGVVLARAPALVWTPSLWAEEGKLFFVRAWEMPWPRALVMQPADYLLAWSNVGVLLASRLVPLEWAPHVTVAWALVAHAFPIAVIATSEAPAWRSRWIRAAAIAVLLFAGSSAEVWLNTINSQFHLALAAALLLLEPPPSTRRRSAAQIALLVACGTSGPATSVLAPLYLWRAWRVRERRIVLQATVVVACALLQVALWSGRANNPRRGSGTDLASAARVVLLRGAVAPVAGGEGVARATRLLDGTADRLAEAAPRVFSGDGARLAAALGCLALALGVTATLLWRTPTDEWLPLGGAWLLTTAAAIGGGLGGPAMLLAGASRYFYLPTVLMLLLLLRAAAVQAGRRRLLRSGICTLLVAGGIASGTTRWRAGLERPPGWPVWRAQVAAWRDDPTRPLHIWPPGWAIRLRPWDANGVPSSPAP